MSVVLPKNYIWLKQSGLIDKNNYFGIENFQSNFFWLGDIKWYSEEVISSLLNEKGFNMDLYPFCRDTSSNFWAFQIKNSNTVFYIDRVEDEGEFYANDFESALFRYIIEFLSSGAFAIGVAEDWQMDIILMKNYLKRYQEMLKPIFDNSWIKQINRFEQLCLDLSKNPNFDGFVIRNDEAKFLIEEKYKLTSYRASCPVIKWLN